jgi:S-formylglutathione hydrolase FrmB
MRKALRLWLILVASCHAFAQHRIECSAIQSTILGRAVRYCVDLPASYDGNSANRAPQRYPVLYFLHGLGDDEQTFFKTGGWTLIDDLRRQKKIGDFVIVAPQGFRSFYINSADSRQRYSDFFLREFLPPVEKKYLVRADREGRALSGVSMGGYGALRFAFAHPELFSSVSAQSPALIVQSPSELNAAAGSGASIVGVLSPVFGNPIDMAHWQQNSVFELARRNRMAIRKLAIYFNCGQSDDYGFEKGAAVLDKQLTQEGITHEYHAYPGDHSLTYFLGHFGETMQFHSRVFERQK